MKISIPEEAVTQIMSDYNCSEEEAAKAFLDAQEEANEAFQTTLAERLGSKKEDASALAPKIYTPKELKRYLDKYVIVQEEY
jgi:ATP-dependent protease Clp ATPase subunit